MTRFSLGGDEDGEGPSSRRPKRLRISVQSNAAVDRDYREREGENCEDEGDQETHEEEEEEEEEESDYEEEEEESFYDEEEEDNVEEEDPGPTVTVGPRSNGGAQVGRDGSISVTLTDPEVLDCSICYEPLSIPVFQVSSLRPLL
jgi:E3 ubiquitin-protein ligase SIAH1